LRGHRRELTTRLLLHQSRTSARPRNRSVSCQKGTFQLPLASADPLPRLPRSVSAGHTVAKHVDTDAGEELADVRLRSPRSGWQPLLEGPEGGQVNGSWSPSSSSQSRLQWRHSASSSMRIRRCHASANRGAALALRRARIRASCSTKSMIAARPSMCTCGRCTSPHSTRPAPTGREQERCWL
jgi:hypothetical protein